jgi:hypothetical protein
LLGNNALSRCLFVDAHREMARDVHCPCQWAHVCDQTMPAGRGGACSVGPAEGAGEVESHDEPHQRRGHLQLDTAQAEILAASEQSFLPPAGTPPCPASATVSRASHCALRVLVG